VRTIVIVEGETDRLALTTAARRVGRDLEAERILVAPIGGAHAIARFLTELRREQVDVEIAGLCDQAEEGIFRSALERAGYGRELSRNEMERLGFFVCEADLEDELIRAIGTEAIPRLTELQGDARAWLTFRGQPAWQARPMDQQFRRFIRSVSDRNARYIRALVDGLEPERLPPPLRRLLTHVGDRPEAR
jgi:hypothetical protein